MEIREYKFSGYWAEHNGRIMWFEDKGAEPEYMRTSKEMPKLYENN